MSKLGRLETNFVTKFGPFIQNRNLTALKFWHTAITKDVLIGLKKPMN